MVQSIESIKAFRKISSHLGTAGQPLASEFPLIGAAGYAVIINLALPSSTGAIAQESELVRGLGLEYVAIPVSWEAPDLQDLHRFFEVMKELGDRRIFVHCAANMRVSVFVYLYRVLRLGLESAVAKEDLEQIWIPNQTWAVFIEKALAHQ
jgi:protein tyrosine phosphatase (PTP) superfamily phosphohydrolase (DUF442 family)